ncbi:protein kinase [Botrimarina sp.]|uniref:protein kinase domain-containing protein n=1 Tax=Botrimarina sp. TaxID=2795802 RepID=UPI0032EBFFF9
MSPTPPNDSRSALLDATRSFASLGDRPPGAHDERLIAALDEYVAALERGDAEPVEAYARRRPELGEELLECLKGVRAIHDAVQAAKQAPGAPAAGDLSATDGFDLPAETPHGAPATIGDYRLIREIGRGGMGVVYEAEEQSLRRRVALKVLPFAAVLDQRQIARFRNEAQAAAGLHHTNIVPVFAIGQERGVHFYAMQHIEGRSLAEAIAELRGGAGAAPSASPNATTQALGDAPPATPASGKAARRSAPSQGESPTAAPTLGPNNRSSSYFRAAARMAADAADALQHAHELGVVHRDIKPSNLLIDTRGKVWVADFGLARMQTDLGVTATGDVVGTLRYMSPEQARGRADQVDGRTDVYALGATLYELLTLRPAHGGNDRRRLLDRLERTDPTPPRKLNPALPADLENIVMKAMEKDRDARYASAGDLRDDLRRYLEGLPTIARPPGVADRVGKWMRRRRRMVATAAVASALVAVVSLAALVVVNQARGRAEQALAELGSQRQLSESLAEEARDLLHHFGVELTDRLAPLPGSEAIRAKALVDTLAYYEKFLRKSGDQADHDGDADAARVRVRAAAVAERLGRRDHANRLYERSAVALEQALRDDADDTDAAWWLARCLHNHALLLGSEGQADPARDAIARSVELWRGLLAESPDDAERIADLAAAVADQAVLAADQSPAGAAGLQEAITLLARAQRVAPDDENLSRRMANAYSSLAKRMRGVDPGRAAEAADQAVGLLRDLVREAPDVEAYRADLAMALTCRGAVANDRSNPQRAESAYAQAADELAWLVQRSPLVPRHRSELAVALASRGAALARLGRYDESDDAFRLAERTLAGLVRDFPDEPRYRRSHAALWNNLGVALRDSDRLDEAADAFARSIDLEEKRLASLNKPGPTLLAQHYTNYARVLHRLDRFDEAAAIETKRRTLLQKASSVASTPPPQQP